MRNKNFGVLVCMLLLCVCALAGCSSGGKLEDLASKEDDKYTCTYEGVKHSFFVCLPEKAQGAPLVIMLHGSGMSGERFQSETKFEEEANALGYAVCYVTGAANAKAGMYNAGWNYGRFSVGNNDIGFLKALVEFLEDKYEFDDERTYCAGFSNGGWMNYRLAMEAPEVFEACVSVAGEMSEGLWKNKADSVDIGFMQITGEKDEGVPQNANGTAQTSPDPAIEDVISYLAEANGLEKQSEETIGKGSILTKYGKDGDEDSVWNIFVKEGRHSWPSEELNEFNTNKLILEFFESRK